MASIVYLLDDDESVRESVTALLELCGATVHPYATAAAFASARFPEDGACLLMDVHLTDGNGLEMLRALRQRGVALPAIVMSGCLDLEQSRLGECLAPVLWLEKPVDGEVIIGMLDELAARGAHSR
ncbi:response regulator [Pseudohoeflea suaedae]|uniref:response regulator n=1 Tax=Pseudohoeflea suaedae TaxID=877384 RepID=UPI001304B611|nr:response regulator [Pseudohoeflea suaedae]